MLIGCFIILPLIAVTLSGCLSIPPSKSFDKPRHQLISALAKKSPCCTPLRDIEVKAIPGKGEWFKRGDENSLSVSVSHYQSYVAHSGAICELY